jgi:REP-associated tyrosine transposase
MAFKLPTHGGRRRGAGRKPKGGKALVSHASRPRFDRMTAAHVTLRVCDHVPSLRSSRRFAAIREVFAEARGRLGLRLVEFTVLSNHLHLVVEADDSKALSRGMQGLCIRLARKLNALLGRQGRVFADHYHSRLLHSPTEVATAIAYVQDNAEHHYGEAGVDAYSSRAPDAKEAVAPARGWLLRVGYKRAPSRPKRPL